MLAPACDARSDLNSRSCPTKGLQLTGFRLRSHRFEVMVEYHDFGLARHRLAVF
jgi:hypothetical protein